MEVRKFDIRAPALPRLAIDVPLHAKLDNHPLLRYMNKSFFLLVLGKPGSGKSSHIYSMLTDPKMLAGCFNKGCVYVVCPPSSLASFGDNSRWADIHPDQFYDECTADTLREIQQKVIRNRNQDKKSLLILDDVQKSLKGACENMLLDIIANRRHKWLWIILAAQNYILIPKQVRLNCSDLFCFNLAKDIMEKIRSEVVVMDKDIFQELFRFYRRQLKEAIETGGRKPFFYINLETPAFFVGWDTQLFWERIEEV